jgi:hypothetical protein
MQTGFTAAKGLSAAYAADGPNPLPLPSIGAPRESRSGAPFLTRD